MTAVPFAIVAAWVGLSLLARAWRLRHPRAGARTPPAAKAPEERREDAAGRREDGAA